VQFNRADPGPPQYGRQPGSSFKPYVWAAALESGEFGPDTSVSADPLTIDRPGAEPSASFIVAGSGKFTIGAARRGCAWFL
jgi:membrane peptidoglycan carboxypeptidase